MVLFLRLFEQQRWKREWWWSSLYGDIFLPLGIASSTVVLRQYTYQHAWYTSRAWNWWVLIVGIICIGLLETYLLLHKQYKIEDLRAYSKIWHTCIFPIMFYLSVPTLIPLFLTRRPTWAYSSALIGYAIWFGLVVRDWIVIPSDYRP